MTKSTPFRGGRRRPGGRASASRRCAIFARPNFEPLAVSFKRIRNILEKAGNEKRWSLTGVRPELFQRDAERKLHAAARRVARKQRSTKKRAGNIARPCRESLRSGPKWTNFLIRVMVMAEQEEIRRNRLTLLAELLSEFSTIADFSEIVAAEK